MKKTLSQRIARFMEASGYLLLVLQISLLLYLTIAETVAGKPLGLTLVVGFMIAIISLPFQLVGCLLLWCYIKHSRARFKFAEARVMWIGTLLSNGLGAYMAIMAVIAESNAKAFSDTARHRAFFK